MDACGAVPGRPQQLGVLQKGEVIGRPVRTLRQGEY